MELSVADVHVGAPPVSIQWRALRKVHFHGFAALPTTRGDKVKSPVFSCFGHMWTLAIYPGEDEVSREGHVAVHLVNESRGSIQTEFKIVFHHPTNQFGMIAEDSMLTFSFGPEGLYRRGAFRNYRKPNFFREGDNADVPQERDAHP